MSSHMEEDDKCSICLNSITESDVYKTQCGHSFHKDCFDQLKKKGFDTCPMCRANLALAKVRTNDNDVVNRIRHDSQSEREEERRLINLALAIINRDNTVTDGELYFMLFASKGHKKFTIKDAFDIFDDDRPAAKRRALSPAASSVARHVASPAKRRALSPAASRLSSNSNQTASIPLDPGWEEKLQAIRNDGDKLDGKTSGKRKKSGGKTKKKGQRIHRRKKNTSRSL